MVRNSTTLVGETEPARSGRPAWSPEDGQWLRTERRKRGLTQREIGAVIARTGARVAEFERARHSRGPTGPSYQQLEAIKGFLERTPVVTSPELPGAKITRMTVEIDDELMRAALRLSDERTKKAVIEEALRELIRARRIEKLLDMIGTYEIDLTPEELRRMRGCE